MNTPQTISEKAIAKREGASPNIMERVIAHGDLAKLTVGERNQYYLETCKSIGLNPLTQPFQYITLNGKLTLYASRNCADQLRKINGISIAIVSREISDGLLTIHARARDSSGREDEDFGVVALPDTLKGEFRANMVLKAVTKAKRRVTLSISGLGWLDETEVEDIPGAKKEELKTVTAGKKDYPSPQERTKDEEYRYSKPLKGEELIQDQGKKPPTEPLSDFDNPDIDELPKPEETITNEHIGNAKAEEGWHALKQWWESLEEEDQNKLRPTLERRWKPTARTRDEAR